MSTDPQPIGDLTPGVLADIAAKRERVKAAARCPWCKDEDCRIIGTAELAEIKGIHPQSARTMLASGQLPLVSQPPGARYKTRECMVREAERRVAAGARR